MLILGAHELFLFGVDALVAMVESDTVAYRSDAGAVEDVLLTR